MIEPKEDMILIFRLQHLHFSSPSTFLHQFYVMQTPVSQTIFLRNSYKDLGAPQTRKIRVLFRVKHWVIQPTP
ncbi:hypothetical protein HanXRQr2_Chr16g0738981 [Helianthus annuus]|uniref:Uncharacterized protein n=1 Tax=Helianthus annuus TaxID=4232 RepID=A0A9K3DR13_HELAN|nr:hypothetical protein HanXRQr2_Chr16g0738981 [Helianthus annuus]